MLTTRLSTLLGIKHPVVLAGMSGHTAPQMVVAACNAGGLGILGCARRPPQEVAQLAGSIRQGTSAPFGLNLLLFLADQDSVDGVLATHPPVFSSAWGFPEHDLASLFGRAHEAGARVMHMATTVPEAVQAAETGADIIVAQGSEGGGHVGVMGTMPLVRMVVKAVSPLPVVAAGGIADGAGLAASLMMGAEGVLLGTRFLATPEAPIPQRFKEVIVASDGHDTVLTEIPDIISGATWPGAFARVIRNRLIEEWAGRENELRRRRNRVLERVRSAWGDQDPDSSVLYMGQTAGLVNDIQPVATIIESVVAEAEEILRERVPKLLENG